MSEVRPAVMIAGPNTRAGFRQPPLTLPIVKMPTDIMPPAAIA